jgi:hypothetical protein
VTWRLATGLFLLFVPFSIAVYDLIAFEVGGNDATISKQCLQLENRTIAFALCLAYLFGMATGHLFLPQHTTTGK